MSDNPQADEPEDDDAAGRAEAWALMKACPSYYHDAEERPHYHSIMMSDVWGWACADGFTLTDANIERVAELYNRYGFPGLLYYQTEADPRYKSSEFTDNNRFLQFVQNEERIRKEQPDYNKRGYYKAAYAISGDLI